MQIRIFIILGLLHMFPAVSGVYWVTSRFSTSDCSGSPIWIASSITGPDCTGVPRNCTAYLTGSSKIDCVVQAAQVDVATYLAPAFHSTAWELRAYENMNTCTPASSWTTTFRTASSAVCIENRLFFGFSSITSFSYRLYFSLFTLLGGRDAYLGDNCTGLSPSEFSFGGIALNNCSQATQFSKVLS